METAAQLRRPLNLMQPAREYTVVASLPKNSTSFAARAEEAGVDAILLNVDRDEDSFPGQYGSYDLHDVYINDVISTVKVPCGIFIGGARPVTQDYWERVMSSQCSFVEMYAHQMPLHLLSDTRVKKIAVIGAGYILEQVKQLSQFEGLDALEAATSPTQARSAPYTLLDQATLGLILGLSSKPVLLRTQKRLTREDISRVLELGATGLVIDPMSVSGAEEAYRGELESLSPRRAEAEQKEQERPSGDSGGGAGDQAETLHLPAAETDAPGGPEAHP
jgi:hypothetical protein